MAKTKQTTGKRQQQSRVRSTSGLKLRDEFKNTNPQTGPNPLRRLEE